MNAAQHTPARLQIRFAGQDFGWVDVLPSKRHPDVEQHVDHLRKAQRLDGTPVYEIRVLKASKPEGSHTTRCQAQEDAR